MSMFKRFSFVSLALFLGIFPLLSPFSASAQITTEPPYSCDVVNTTNLRIGSRGKAVYELQRILNASVDTQIAATGPGSPNNETRFFGKLTALAVVKFQDIYTDEILTPAGVTRGTGYVGPSTRAQIAKVCAGLNQSAEATTESTVATQTQTTARTSEAAIAPTTNTTQIITETTSTATVFNYRDRNNKWKKWTPPPPPPVVPPPPSAYTLSVSKSGTGSGTVSGTGISCGSDCSETYTSGTNVTLIANTNIGSSFIGWSGACSGTGTCSVSMTNTRSVTATFSLIPTPPPPVTPPPPPVNPPPPPTSGTTYPLHTNITAAVFWVGEPIGNGSSEDNGLSAWDDAWQTHYGGFDDPQNRIGYYPVGFIPKENPFYLDLPYNDFNDNGSRRSNASQVIPWAGEKTWTSRESMLKNRWVKLMRNGITCYGQIEDSGPYVYDDANYVFGTSDQRPRSTIANNAGMDVSPALRDCLQFNGWNNVDNKVDWQFVNAADVPPGPWKDIITTSQVYWP